MLTRRSLVLLTGSSKANKRPDQTLAVIHTLNDLTDFYLKAKALTVLNAPHSLESGRGGCENRVLDGPTLGGKGSNGGN